MRRDEVAGLLDEADLPWSLPSSWKWVRLGDIANIKHGFAFSSESFTTAPTQYVLTTPGNFYESGGFRDRGANTKYFRGEIPPAFIFNTGDLIIPMTEQAAGLLGSPAFIPDDGKSCLHNQRLGKLEFVSIRRPPFWRNPHPMLKSVDPQVLWEGVDGAASAVGFGGVVHAHFGSIAQRLERCGVLPVARVVLRHVHGVAESVKS
jgi:hypothetical protein